MINVKQPSFRLKKQRSYNFLSCWNIIQRYITEWWKKTCCDDIDENMKDFYLSFSEIQAELLI